MFILSSRESYPHYYGKVRTCKSKNHDRGKYTSVGKTVVCLRSRDSSPDDGDVWLAEAMFPLSSSSAAPVCEWQNVR